MSTNDRRMTGSSKFKNVKRSQYSNPLNEQQTQQQAQIPLQSPAQETTNVVATDSSAVLSPPSDDKTAAIESEAMREQQGGRIILEKDTTLQNTSRHDENSEVISHDLDTTGSIEVTFETEDIASSIEESVSAGEEEEYVVEEVINNEEDAYDEEIWEEEEDVALSFQGNFQQNQIDAYDEEIWEKEEDVALSFQDNFQQNQIDAYDEEIWEEEEDVALSFQDNFQQNQIDAASDAAEVDTVEKPPHNYPEDNLENGMLEQKLRVSSSVEAPNADTAFHTLQNSFTIPDDNNESSANINQNNDQNPRVQNLQLPPFSTSPQNFTEKPFQFSGHDDAAQASRNEDNEGQLEIDLEDKNTHKLGNKSNFIQEDKVSPPVETESAVAQSKEEKNYHQEGEQTRYCCKLKSFDCLLVVLIVLVIIALAISMPILYKRGKLNLISPTSAPTMSPTSRQTFGPSRASENSYTVAGGPFYGAPGSATGTAVAIDGDFAASGSPMQMTGTVNTYARNEFGAWFNGLSLSGNQAQGKFGSALALRAFDNGASLLVGAPKESANASSTLKTGTAYFYTYNETLRDWPQLGTVLTGLQDTGANGEEFGAAVAFSDTSRVVVGAPKRFLGDGSVYTFQYTPSTDWKSTSSDPLTVTAVGGNFGSSIALTADGSIMVVGAPLVNNGTGKIFIFNWNDAISEWELVFSAEGGTGEKLGSSVTFLSTLGDQIAAGAPGHQYGKIYVYQQNEGSLEYVLLGQGITGTAGEEVGLSMTGVNFPSGRRMAADVSSPVLFVGSSNGTVKTLEFDAASLNWVQTYKVVNAGDGSAVTSLSATNGFNSFIAGIAAADKFTIYQNAVSNESTMAPTPLTSRVGPTVIPITYEPVLTTPPTPSPSSKNWIQVGPNILGASTNLGVSVSLSNTIMAAGASLEFGEVKTYLKDGDAYNISYYDIVGLQSNGLFGNSISLNQQDSSLLVGAPGVYATGTSTATGVAYYYNINTSNSSYVLQGSAIRGDEDIYSAGEAFAYSVATSTSATLAIGAPWSNYGNVQRRGRVYTFINDGNWSQQSKNASMLGQNPGDLLGSAVDISADGARIVAGAPGSDSGAGSVVVYQWNEISWVKVYTSKGNTTSEALGTSVKFLSLDGSIFAVGGPGYSLGAGVVRVYQLQQSGVYAPYGAIIEGSSGDSLGMSNSLAGSEAALLTSTSSGIVRTYAYLSSTNSWEEIIAALDTGLNSNPAISTGSGTLSSLVAGSQNQVKTYHLA